MFSVKLEQKKACLKIFKFFFTENNYKSHLQVIIRSVTNKMSVEICQSLLVTEFEIVTFYDFKAEIVPTT